MQRSDLRRPKTRFVPLEVAVFSGRSALEAQRLGASRVELNAPGSYAVGGLTPRVEELASIRDRLEIPVHIMIRPRGAPAANLDGTAPPDFVYTADELQEMTASIGAFKAAGIMNPLQGDRFVFGVVREAPIKAADDDGAGSSGGTRIAIDEPACRALIESAKPFGCVFHRAFDAMAAKMRGVEDAVNLANIGFEAILTCGGPSGTCCDRANVDTIDHLCHRVDGRLQMIVGGGLRRWNANYAASQLAVYGPAEHSVKSSVWFHTAAVKKADDGTPTEELDTRELHDLLIRLGEISPV